MLRSGAETWSGPKAPSQQLRWRELGRSPTAPSQQHCGGGNLVGVHGAVTATCGGGNLVGVHGAVTATCGGGNLVGVQGAVTATCGAVKATFGGGNFVGPQGAALAAHTHPRRRTITPNFRAIKLRVLIRTSPGGIHNRLGTLLCQSNAKCVGALQQKCHGRKFLTEVLIREERR